MQQLAKVGRSFYSIGIIVLGLQQIISRKFRSEILSPFPDWLNNQEVFPILTGVFLVCAGILISGWFKLYTSRVRDFCLFFGLWFLALIVLSHLPYIFIFSPNRAFRLDVWFGVGEALAYSGGAFVMASTFPDNANIDHGNRASQLLSDGLIPAGRILFSILMFIFGCSHLVYTQFVSTMVPKYFGIPYFWTYLVGVLLIAAAIAIIFKIWIKIVSFLLAIMLFIFLVLFHVPEAIANPTRADGNEIVRCFLALLFCGVALVIGVTGGAKIKN